MPPVELLRHKGLSLSVYMSINWFPFSNYSLPKPNVLELKHIGNYHQTHIKVGGVTFTIFELGPFLHGKVCTFAIPAFQLYFDSTKCYETIPKYNSFNWDCITFTIPELSLFCLLLNKRAPKHLCNL